MPYKKVAGMLGGQWPLVHCASPRVCWSMFQSGIHWHSSWVQICRQSRSMLQEPLNATTGGQNEKCRRKVMLGGSCIWRDVLMPTWIQDAVRERTCMPVPKWGLAFVF